MSARRFPHTSPLTLVVVIAAACCAMVAASVPAPAQDAASADVDNSKYQMLGAVNSNAVFVRSGASENDYATLKLDKGAPVKVLGIKFNWLKIVPPDGSFCYVAKAFIDRRGAGNVGRVTQTLNVRVGSALNELKAKIASKLEPGVDVEIIGEEQEYYKIKPPPGVFFYINAQYVDLVRKIELSPDGKELPTSPVADASQPSQPKSDTPIATDPSSTTGGPENTTVVQGNDASSNPSTQPSNTLVAKTDSAAPSTQPSDVENQFDKLEGEFAQASLKPLEEQPVHEMLDAYTKLSADAALPESMRRIADFRTQVLKTRADAKDQLVEVKKVQDDMKQKQMALRAERAEIEQRLKQTQITFYTACGTLRPSSIQQGNATLYRLTDPANGRSVVYLRSDDDKLGGAVGQFIGVKGEVASDQNLNLRIVTVTSFETVNPAKVGQSVAAQIVPPSLLPGASAAPQTADTNVNDK